MPLILFCSYNGTRVKGIFIMIYSSRLLKHPKLRLPSIPDVFVWNIRVEDDGTAYLTLESSEGVYASQKLVHPMPTAEVEYLGVISRAGASLRWELETQLELEARAIAKRNAKKS